MAHHKDLKKGRCKHCGKDYNYKIDLEDDEYCSTECREAAEYLEDFLKDNFDWHNLNEQGTY